MKTFSLIVGLLLLIALEILRVYFIMPFPGSQKKATINISYWLDRNIFWLRILLLILVAYPVVSTFKRGRNWKRMTRSLILIPDQNGTWPVSVLMVRSKAASCSRFSRTRKSGIPGSIFTRIPKQTIVIRNASCYPEWSV